MSVSISTDVRYINTAQELNRRLMSAAQRGNADLYMAIWGQLERLSEINAGAEILASVA